MCILLGNTKELVGSQNDETAWLLQIEETAYGCTINGERGKVNEIFGNYMAIRVQQKGEKKQSPDLG